MYKFGFFIIFQITVDFTKNWFLVMTEKHLAFTLLMLI